MTVTANPPIVSRSAWGANPVTTPAGSIATPTPDLWLHHTGGNGHGAGYMRSLQQGALRGGYADLEYTVVVDTDGTIYMSRGIGRNTAATGGSTGGQSNNTRSHAICAMGQFDTNYPGTTQPTDALLDGIASAVRWLHANGAIANPRITGPHQAAPGNSTACCGNLLIARIGDINARAAGGSSGGGGGSTGGGDLPADKDFVDRLVTAEGTWDLQFDGGVKTIRGPFYGSYFSLPASARNDPNRRFRVIAAPQGGGPSGYDLVSTKGETYQMRTKQ